jgi:hypothetical protein
VLEDLAYSSAWVAMAAGALSAAAALAMGARPDPWAVTVAVAGTWVVYNVDRLRDLERDRATTPRRSAFVAAHRRILTVLTAGAAALGAVGAAVLGPGCILLLAPVLALGLLHRRLKQVPFAKSVYVTAAWLAVVVGLPALAADAPVLVGRVAGVLGCALFANAIASSARDVEAAAELIGTEPMLWTSRAVAALGVLLGLTSPPPVRVLSVVPVATLATLIPFRRGERYGLLIVDGALLAGAAAAVVWLW